MIGAMPALGSVDAQVLPLEMLVNGDFEQWEDNLPAGWYGPRSNIGADNVNRYSADPQSGANAVQLVNTGTSGLRFTSQGYQMLAGRQYTVSYWVRGKGQIWVRYADYRNTTGPGGTSYLTVDADEWQQIQVTFTPAQTYESDVLIFMVRLTDPEGGHIQIDNVVVTSEGDDEEPEYIAIAEAKELEDGEEVTVKGVVTTTPGIYGGNGFYVQDATGGIYAYSGPAVPCDYGDTVYVTGTLGVYGGERQLSNLQIVVADEHLPEPKPALRQPSEISLADEGLLVRLEAVEIAAVEELSYGTFVLTVRDETGAEVRIRVDNRIGITYSQFSGGIGDSLYIVGVIGQHGNEMYVKARNPLELFDVNGPRTVAQAIAYNVGTVPVTGYIVGTVRSGGFSLEPPFTVTTNIAIADSPDEKDFARILGVQLPQGGIRDALNLVDNPDNLGLKVEITGELAAYYSMPGLRSPTSYRFVIDADPGEMTIAEARQLGDGFPVIVTGVITTPVGIYGGNGFYVQDETGGINAFTFDSVGDVGYGDTVIITGTMDTFNQERQIAVESVVLAEEGMAMPQPLVVTADEVQQNEGLLVRLERATVAAIGPPRSDGSINIALQDHTGAAAMHINYRTNIDYSMLAVGDEVRVTGVSGQFSGAVIKLRTAEDLEVLPPSGLDDPIIYQLTPTNLSGIYDRRPEIGANIADNYAIDWGSLEFTINGQAITNWTREGQRIIYVPEQDLELGRYEVAISVTNSEGFTATRTWLFNVIEYLTDPLFIRGVPHSHTSYSDGAGTPTEAYEFALNIGIDYLFVTDHSNWLDGDLYHPDRNQYLETEGSQWWSTRIEAEEFNLLHDDVFTALRGFEMTFQDVGHINVYATTNYVERNTMSSLFEFYQWMMDVYEEEDGKIFAAFNHPNWPSDSFNNLAYVPELDKIIQLIEVANGAPPYSYVRAEGHYIKALDQGWHVGAVNSQDNHARNWGAPDNLTGLVVTDNTAEAIYEAMRARRTYATETRRLELTFKANDFWMGSVVCAEVLDFEVELFDPDVAIEKVEVITNGGAVLDTLEVGGQNHVQWVFSHVPGPGRQWYYVRVTHVNGALAWSSPIFTPPGEVDIALIDLVVDPSPNIPHAPTSITATVANFGIFPASDITLDFYVGSIAEENKVATERIEILYAGRQASVSTEVAFAVPGNTRVYAVLQAEEAGQATLDRGVQIVPAIGKTMLIDIGHNNDYAPGTLLDFIRQMRFHGYNTILNQQPFSAQLLEDVDVVVLTQPANNANLTATEEEALAFWVQQGGALLLAGKSNHNNDPTMVNSLLEKMNAEIRINHDNVYETDEANYTGGMIWSVLARTFPAVSDGINNYMEYIRIFSAASLVNSNLEALANDAASGLEIIVQANPTSYNYNVQPGYYTYNPEGGDQGHAVPLVARQQVGDGRLVAMGRAIFSDFELGNNFANDRLVQELVDWLAGYQRAIAIEAARTQHQAGDVVTVRGIVTSPTGHFFDVFYIQDQTGGISVYGEQVGTLPVGTEVMVTGTLEEFEGELELAYSDWGVQVLKSGPSGIEVEPIQLSTAESMLTEHQGKLITTIGEATAIDLALGTVTVDDGSGPALIHVDGYLGIDISGLELGRWYSFTGLGSHGSMGPRLRIRFPEDIVETEAPVHRWHPRFPTTPGLPPLPNPPNRPQPGLPNPPNRPDPPNLPVPPRSPSPPNLPLLSGPRAPTA